METEKETLEKLRSEISGREGNDHIIKAPIIRTYESDVLGAIKSDNIKSSDIISMELDKSLEHQDINMAAVNLEKKKKFILTFSIVTVFILIVSLLGYYGYSYNQKNKLELARAAEAKALIEYENSKQNNIKSLWPSIDASTISYIDDATSTVDSVIFKIKDFDNLFSYIKTKDGELQSVAGKMFKYKSISQFEKVSINNRDLYVSDGTEGLILYGFVGRDYLVISNNVNKWLQIEKTLTNNK